MATEIKAKNIYDAIKLSDSITRPANTTDYAAGDVISAVTTNDYYTFVYDSTGKVGRLKGHIQMARMMVNANQTTKPDIELWLFDTAIAEVADNGAFAPTDAEILTLIDIIPFGVDDWTVGLAGAGASGNIVQTKKDLNIIVPETNAAKSIYGQLVVRNAYTPIASEQFDCHLIMTLDE